MTLRIAFVLCLMVAAWHLPASAVGVSQHQPIDSIGEAVRFSLVVDQVEIASFTEAVEISLAAVAPKSSLPPQRSGSDRGLVVLRRRHVPENSALWDWVQMQIATGRPIKAASIILYNTKGDPVARYHLTDAWPAKVEIGALKAGASEVLMETVTMTCEFIQRVSV